MKNQTAGETIDLTQNQFARWGIQDCYRLRKELRLMQLNSSNFNSANERRLNIPYLYHITTKVKEKLNPQWRLLKLCWGNLRNQNYVRMKHFLASTTHLGMTTSTTQRFPNRRTRTEIHMKYCCHRRLQKNMIAEETKKKQKSQAYYHQTTKDLTELKLGDSVRVRPEGLLKEQEYKKGRVLQNCGYRSYDVNVDGKLVRRNRVHPKKDIQGKSKRPNDPRNLKYRDWQATVVEKTVRPSQRLQPCLRCWWPPFRQKGFNGTFTFTVPLNCTVSMQSMCIAASAEVLYKAFSWRYRFAFKERQGS